MEFDSKRIPVQFIATEEVYDRLEKMSIQTEEPIGYLVAKAVVKLLSEYEQNHET